MIKSFEDNINQAIIQSNIGNQAGAIKLLLDCEKIQKGNDWVNLNLANCYVKDNQDDLAKEYLQKILSGQKADAKTLLNLNKLAIRIYRFDLAVLACEKAEKLEPNSLDVLAALIQAKKEARKRAGINKLCKRMISLLPGNPWAYSQLASNYLTNGKFNKAEKSYKKALTCDSNYSFTYSGLVKSIKFKNKPKKLIKQLDIAIANNQDPEAIARLCLSKAKILNDCGKYRKAWDMAEKGKSIKAEIVPFDVNNFNKHIDQMMNVYSKKEVKLATDNKSKPVCIVGMPRSGTTLIEQILSTYPEFYPGGETPALDNAFFQQFKGGSYLNHSKTISKQQLNAMAKDYESFFKRFSNYSGNRIIDKIPMHFMHIGIYMQMFPNAKFINFERDKYDVATSILFENFSLKYNYTHKVTDILQIVDSYKKLMSFWEEIFPHSILTVKYNDFVLSHEATKQNILNFVGVDKSTKEDYKGAKNAIETPSVWQARQPIYKSSVNRWKRYPQMVEIVNYQLNGQ